MYRWVTSDVGKSEESHRPADGFRVLYNGAGDVDESEPDYHDGERGSVSYELGHNKPDDCSQEEPG